MLWCLLKPKELVERRDKVYKIVENEGAGLKIAFPDIIKDSNRFIEFVISIDQGTTKVAVGAEIYPDLYPD